MGSTEGNHVDRVGDLAQLILTSKGREVGDGERKRGAGGRGGGGESVFGF